MKKMSAPTAMNVQLWTNIVTCVLLILPLFSVYIEVFGLAAETLLIINATIAFISGAFTIVMKIFFTEKPSVKASKK